ncbi:hypothetical protein [Kribbella sp.]|uniref:hypothetical protein n=1 Tax=Kribbella sp. TaxID=1871183 RepID=UPI002D27D55E|nr:hypothetical protein [Kribbella sp.]HZX06439.1 hypothetical protein [Kribbella sp.]
MYHYVDAEVPGGLAPECSYDKNQRVADSGLLHLVFDGWMGADLVTTVAFWFVTERLAAALRASDLTGYELEPARASQGEQYALVSDREVPPDWFRLIPGGRAGQDDFALDDGTELVVSDAALRLLQSFDLADAWVADYEDVPAAGGGS